MPHFCTQMQKNAVLKQFFASKCFKIVNIQKRYGLCRLHCSFTPKEPIFSTHPYLYISIYTVYPKNEINTPAATAEPITPEILLAIQY